MGNATAPHNSPTTTTCPIENPNHAPRDKDKHKATALPTPPPPPPPLQPLTTTANIIDFNGPNDPTHPLNWSTTRKTTSIFIISMNALLSPIGSTITATSAPQILHDFAISNSALTALITTIYLLGYAFGPFLIAPLAEMYGKQPLLRICSVLFLVFNIACALTPTNITPNAFPMLIIFRLLTGIAGSCPGTLGASSIADMIPREKRGAAMAAYVLGPTLGPTLGPVIGGFLTPSMGWRWGFWVMSIAAAAVMLGIWVGVRESYPRAILAKKVETLRRSTGRDGLRSRFDVEDESAGGGGMGKKTSSEVFKQAISRPVKMLVLPVVFLQSMYAATVYSYAFLCFTTFPRVFEEQYGFGSESAGLANIGIGVGFIVGLVFCMVVSDPWAARLAKRQNDGVAKSEYRLPPLLVGAVLTPIGLFCYGWTAEYRVHWIAPIMGTAVMGIGIVVIYSTSATYLVDAYPVYSASVMAASATFRSVFGAVLPLAGGAMFDTLGVGWGNSLLGFIALAFLPLPFLFYIYGERLRRHKIFMTES